MSKVAYQVDFSPAHRVVGEEGMSHDEVVEMAINEIQGWTKEDIIEWLSEYAQDVEECDEEYDAEYDDEEE